MLAKFQYDDDDDDLLRQAFRVLREKNIVSLSAEWLQTKRVCVCSTDYPAGCGEQKKEYKKRNSLNIKKKIFFGLSFVQDMLGAKKTLFRGVVTDQESVRVFY